MRSVPRGIPTPRPTVVGDGVQVATDEEFMDEAEVVDEVAAATSAELDIEASFSTL